MSNAISAEFFFIELGSMIPQLICKIWMIFSFRSFSFQILYDDHVSLLYLKNT